MNALLCVGFVYETLRGAIKSNTMKNILAAMIPILVAAFVLIILIAFGLGTVANFALTFWW